MSSLKIIRGVDNILLLSSFLPAGADPTIYTAFLSVCKIPTPGKNLVLDAIGTPIALHSPAHGLSVGDNVAVVNVGGNTAARGTFAITVVADGDHFSLGGSTTSAAFTRGGEWYPALPDACGLAFTGSPPAVTLPGSLGLVQGQGYVLVVTCTGTYRDHFNALAYVSADDNQI